MNKKLYLGWERKTFIFLFLSVFFLAIASSQEATLYQNCEIYGNCVESTSVDFENSSAYVNNSEYLQGFTPTDFWQSFNSQTGLTGSKTGSFVIDTTGDGTFGSFVTLENSVGAEELRLLRSDTSINDGDLLGALMFQGQEGARDGAGIFAYAFDSSWSGSNGRRPSEMKLCTEDDSSGTNLLNDCLIISLDGSVSTTQSITASTFLGSGASLTGITHTVDTNASTSCAGNNVYLSGDGNCVTDDNNGNPFNQSLNTTDNVTFYDVMVDGHGYANMGFGALTGNPPNDAGITRGFGVNAGLGQDTIYLPASTFYALSSEATVSPLTSGGVISGYFSAILPSHSSQTVLQLSGMDGLSIPTALINYTGTITNAIGVKSAISDFGSNVTTNAYGVQIGIVGGNTESYGLYIQNVQGKTESELAAIMDESPNNAGWHLRKDNKTLYFGENDDSFTYWDGNDQIWNLTTGNLLIKNNTGWAVVDAHDFVTHTFNESIDNPLEQFTEDTTVYDAYTEVTDYENFTIVHDKTIYCVDEINFVTVLNLGSTNVCVDDLIEVPEDAQSYYIQTEVYKNQYETKLIKGTSQGQLLADLQGFAKDLNNNVNLYDNLTDFDVGIMVEELYTQSKVIDLETNYALRFFNDTLANKSTHKNKKYLNIPELPEYDRDVLNVEDRIVDLEGAFYNHMECAFNHQKYEDYRVCMGFEA